MPAAVFTKSPKAKAKKTWQFFVYSTSSISKHPFMEFYGSRRCSSALAVKSATNAYAD
ncbi:hypothetical protein HMPREF1981_02381 [Bacteroides pyogenes F0041]|uniref:Uncharacterized protein n=1 Tax=Bacteroides pyogenes F0041 TaxID=1321819 RepID=U2C1W8_9BACE|nr:hypothetical protein HMPREF1981_02381 [Bacteroides pyogenes F0041]